MGNLIKAMAYLRVSSAQQAEDDRTGYARQQGLIEAYAAENDIEIVGTYQEAYTGTEHDRPEFTKMVMDMLMTKDVRLILVESMDRFSRNAAYGFKHLSDLLLQGLDITDCSTGESMNEMINGHPMQEFMVHMRMMLSHFERRMLGYRLTQGRKKASQRKGGLYVAGPKAKYGDDFRQQLKGMRESGMTYAAIANKLNEGGSRTHTNKAWTAPLVSAVIRGGRKKDHASRKVTRRTRK